MHDLPERFRNAIALRKPINAAESSRRSRTSFRFRERRMQPIASRLGTAAAREQLRGAVIDQP